MITLEFQMPKELPANTNLDIEDDQAYALYTRAIYTACETSNPNFDIELGTYSDSVICTSDDELVKEEIQSWFDSQVRTVDYNLTAILSN